MKEPRFKNIRRVFSGQAYDPASGRESRSAFIAQAAFWLSAVKLFMNGVSVKVWGLSVNLGTIDAALLGAFLIPCLALYWGRRASDSHFNLGLGTQAPTPEKPTIIKPTAEGEVG